MTSTLTTAPRARRGPAAWQAVLRFVVCDDAGDGLTLMKTGTERIQAQEEDARGTSLGGLLRQ